MIACLYFYDPVTVGKLTSSKKKKDAEVSVIVLQYLGQRGQVTRYRNLPGEPGGGAGNQRSATLCRVELIMTITINHKQFAARTSDITSHSPQSS